MKIRVKIFMGFMAVVFVGLMIGTVAFVSAGMLSSIAAEMHEVQLESISISNILNAHYLWRQNLTESVLNGF